MEMRPQLRLLLVIFLTWTVGVLVADPLPVGKVISALIEGNNVFALDLYRSLRATEPGNLFFSPVSIHSALAMTYYGADGTTAREMQEVLGLPGGDQGNIEQGFKLFLGSLPTVPKQDGAVLSIANALWSKKGYKFDPAFRECLLNAFSTNLNQVDFTAAQAAADLINGWVGRKTADRITHLVDSSQFNADTCMVLTNAIYFKGKWLAPFPAEMTRPGVFYKGKEETVPAQMMCQMAFLPYFESPDLQALKMPYQGNEVSMVILLPRERDGLATLEANLSTAGLGEWMRGLGKARMTITLPRFSLTTNYALRDILTKVGMPSAFDRKVADFSRMVTPGKWQELLSQGMRLFISAVIHQAFVAVNEEGTEAAAGTAIDMRASGGPPPDLKTFTADHPFLFLIVHEPTGTILFLGRVKAP